MKKSPMLIFIGLLALSLVAGITGQGYSAEKARFGVNISRNPYYTLPALAAEEKGLWKNLGLDAKYMPFNSGTNLQRALAAGALDLGIEGVGGIIQGLTRGLKVRIIADPDILTHFYFWVKSDSRLKKPEDLKGGAKIGVTRFGSETHIYAQAVVKALGVEKNVKIMALGGVPAQVAGIKAGAIDITNLSNFTMARLKSAGVARELLYVYDYVPKGLGSYQMIVARQDFLKKMPSAAKKGAQGYLQGGDYVMKNKGWAVEKMKTIFNYPENVALDVYPIMTYAPSGKINRKRIAMVRDFLIQSGILMKGKAPDLDDIYTTRFLK